MKKKPVIFGLMWCAQGGASYGDGAQSAGGLAPKGRDLSRCIEKKTSG